MDQHVARPLPIHRTIHTQNDHIHTSSGIRAHNPSVRVGFLFMTLTARSLRLAVLFTYLTKHLDPVFLISLYCSFVFSMLMLQHYFVVVVCSTWCCILQWNKESSMMMTLTESTSHTVRTHHRTRHKGSTTNKSIKIHVKKGKVPVLN
jgi:hypothetical protein